MTKDTSRGRPIAPAEGKLGVLLPGMGAVATTFMAGVEAIRKGLSKPVGSLTQMGTVRLGKRTDNRSPRIDELVPIATLDDIVFGGWDIYTDNAYEAARKAGVLNNEHLQALKPFLETIKPWPAVFDPVYVKKLHGENVKKGKNKRDLAEQVVADIEDFKKKNGLSRLVMVWCGSTEVYREAGDVHSTIEKFEKGLEESHPDILPSMIYAYAAIKQGIPYANGAPNLSADIPALIELAKKTGTPIRGKDFKTGQTLMKTILAPGFKARLLGLDGWFSTNILGNRDGEVLDDPESFKTQGGHEARRARAHPAAPPLSRPLRQDPPRGAHQLLPAARRQQGGLGQHRHLRVDGLPDADQGGLPLPRLDPGRAHRARPGPLLGPRRSRGHERHPGVAVVLLQEPDDRARPLPRARPVHPAHEAQEHAAPPARARS